MSAEFEIVLHIASAITGAIVIAMIVIGIIRLKRKARFPKYTVNATVVSKRAKARRHSQKTDTGTQIVTDTFCYVTFKEADTNILELKVSVSEYMALNKGESGKLTFQGGNFLGFEKSNGELVLEAATVNDEVADNKKHFFGRKSKVQAEKESEKIGADEQEGENKERNKKRKSKVKAQLEEIVENVPELEAGVENSEIEDMSNVENSEIEDKSNIDSEDGEAESVASDV